MTGPIEALGGVRRSGAPDEVAGGVAVEDVGELDDAVLHPAGQGRDLSHGTAPLRSRSRWTTRSMALATVGTTKSLETFSPASSGSVQILMMASLAELAWMVHMDGRPEFMAMRRSRASASRTSPMRRRSGACAGPP